MYPKLRSRLRVTLVCVVLHLGTLCGVPMRPEQIDELMRAMGSPKVAHVLRAEDEHGDGDGP